MSTRKIMHFSNLYVQTLLNYATKKIRKFTSQVLQMVKIRQFGMKHRQKRSNQCSTPNRSSKSKWSNFASVAEFCPFILWWVYADQTNIAQLFPGHAHSGKCLGLWWEQFSFEAKETVHNWDRSLFQVSIFLKDKVQNSNGRFVLPTNGLVPCGIEEPGVIRWEKYFTHNTNSNIFKMLSSCSKSVMHVLSWSL